MKILLDDYQGNRHEIYNANELNVISDVKQLLANQTHYLPPPESLNILWIFNGQNLDDDTSLLDYGIEEGSLIEEKHYTVPPTNEVVDAVPSAPILTVVDETSETKPVPLKRATFQINVQDLDGHEFQIPGIQGSQTVTDFKEKLAILTGVRPEDQSLMYLGLDLVDGTLLSEYNIVNGCTINMVHRSTGGTLTLLYYSVF